MQRFSMREVVVLMILPGLGGLLLAGLIGLGVFFFVMGPKKQTVLDAPSASAPTSASAPVSTVVPSVVNGKELVETKYKVPELAAPAAYRPRGMIIDIELSEYAGYAGLIVANGGLGPNKDSWFFKKHGVQVNIKLSEDENWGELTSGQLAASATTADVVALYGEKLGVIVPAQIAFSRGADGVVVRRDIQRINQLKGRILVTSQFNEADFLIRFLANEADLGINMLPNLKTAADENKLNLVFAQDGKQGGELFLRDVQGGGNLLAGCVTWAPFTTEAVEQSKGKTQLLVTSRNLLIIADVLVVNKGFAAKNPKMVRALVEGLLQGNRMVRDNPDAHADTIANAFGWERAEVSKELGKVLLSNLPENLAFFSDDVQAAGTFGSIYQSTVNAYGKDLIQQPLGEGEKLFDLRHLQGIHQSGAFKEQQVAIAPVQTETKTEAPLNPVLSKDIHFYFKPNSAELSDNKENKHYLEAITKLLQFSPGSTVLLRGHVDDARLPEFREQGEDVVKKMALTAVRLSKDRADEVKQVLVDKYRIDPKRVDTFGAGWSEPVSKSDIDKNRRVEVQWFTLE